MSRNLKILFGTIVILAALLFLYSIASLLKILIVAPLFAYLLDPLANALESRGLKRSTATGILFAGIVGILAGFILLILPVLSREIQAIQEVMLNGQAEKMVLELEKLLSQKLSSLGLQQVNIYEKLQALLASVGNQIFNLLLNAVSLITNLVIIPFIMFFLIKDGREIKKRVISLVPNRYFEFSLNLIYKMDLQLGNYLRGQFLDALTIGILSILALWMLDVNYFVLIGAFAGLANLIPYVGPIAGAIPAIVVSIMQVGSFDQIPWIVLAFAIIQLLDNVLVQPLVVAKTVNLHPLIVLLVVIIGGNFFGILGMLLAVPATGVLKVIIQETYLNYQKYRFS